MSSAPFVSVIIVNYNGARYLPMCLEALRKQTYPRDRFEVIVSDNGSTDDSLQMLNSRYPWVRVVANGRNLGFSGGNNAAFKVSKGEYIVLLNNDAKPEPTWLENLVSAAEKDPRIGMVTAKLLLFYDQVTLSLEAYPEGDPATTSSFVRIYGVSTELPGGVIQYLEGFSGWVKGPSGLRFRRMRRYACLGIPAPPEDRDWLFSLKVMPEPPVKAVRLRISVQSECLAEFEVAGAPPSEFQIRLPARLRKQATPLIQNAGSILFENGAGRDRGTFVRDNQVFYEEDRGQYDRVEEVAAGCGASLLIRRKVLEEVGLLDERFFLYYEDTDFSLRARRRGWKIVYTPQAVVRHIHCGTSVEWSPPFIRYTNRNRLAMLLKNAPLKLALRELVHYFVLTFAGLSRVLGLWLVKGRRLDGRSLGQAMVRGRVLLDLLFWLPVLLWERHRINRSAVITAADLWSRWSKRYE